MAPLQLEFLFGLKCVQLFPYLKLITLQCSFLSLLECSILLGKLPYGLLVNTVINCLIWFFKFLKDIIWPLDNHFILYNILFNQSFKKTELIIVSVSLPLILLVKSKWLSRHVLPTRYGSILILIGSWEV